MLLGKRPRPPIKRTASMRGITVDVSNLEPSDQVEGINIHQRRHKMDGYDDDDDQQYNPISFINSPRYNNYATSSDSFNETADFLRTCGLCQRRLAPGKDIYMYRGDTAFCSYECREKQMKQVERKENNKYNSSSSSSSSSSSKKKQSHHEYNASAPPRPTKS